MQNTYQKPKKLNYQIQQVAFQKYPFQINNKPFFCYQSYFQGQLLNGIDLQLDEVKGMSTQPQKVAYMPPSQQLVLVIGSNLIAFNTQKRYYSLLSQIDGYVQLIRTYNCKISNKSYLIWLQSDQEGKNNKKVFEHNSQQQNNLQNKAISNSWIKSTTSMANLLNSQKSLKKNQQNKNNQQNKVNQQHRQIQNIIHKNQQQQNNKTIHNLKLGGMKKNKKLDQNINDQQKVNKKQTKNVNFNLPNLFGQVMQQSQIMSNKRLKKMRITIFDYQRKKIVHKQAIQILQQQKISQILFYCTPQKILGYIINNQCPSPSCKVYYRRIQFQESNGVFIRNTISKRYLHKKQSFSQVKAQNFNLFQFKFQINNLKYNGQIDSYLFVKDNVLYSVELSTGDYEIISKVSMSKMGQGKQSQKSLKKSVQSINSISSINTSNNDEELSKSKVDMTDNKVGTNKDNKKQDNNSKYKIRVYEQISIQQQQQQQLQQQQQQKLIDFAINQTYLVILSTKHITFYSVFNLNIMLFKCKLPDLSQYPQLFRIQINKSYIILTHEKSTFISLFTILQRDIKYNTTCEIQIQHCEGILKLFMNNYNCQVSILARQFQIQGRMTNIIKSKKMIVNSTASFRKSFIDVSLAYINFSSTKCESKPLFLKKQKFKDVLTCKWHSQYLLLTQNQIIAKYWRQSFENLKCAALHPTGQYMIIGFNDCFKVYAVTFEGLQNTYMSDGVKDCQTIAYSEYGEHFAVGSANSIGIYNSYNCRKKQTISFPVGTSVQSLQYKFNYLFCILKNKRIIVYQILLDYKQIFTFNPRNYINQNKHQFQRRPGESLHNLLALAMNNIISIQINSLFYDVNLNVVIFSYGKKLFFLNTQTNQILGNYDIQPISCMQYSQYLSTLFLGTEKGELIAFPWPNKPSNILDQLPRFKFHSQKIIEIKITPDYKYLMTISSDQSIYKSNISFILNLKRLKGNQIYQYKGNKTHFHFTNFLYNKGLCQFSQPQNIQKIQTRKQYQQQVVNTVFMLPQQRLKQKQNLFSQLSVTKSEIVLENRKAEEPLQKQSLVLRNNVIVLKDKYETLKKGNDEMLEEEKNSIKEQTSKLLKIYSDLNSQLRMVKIQLNQQLQKAKYEHNKIYQQQIKNNEQQYKQLQKKLKQTNNQTKRSKDQFQQIKLIQQQKQKYLQTHLKAYIKQLQILNSKNGQLSCKNSTLQKQILMLKYRIQQLKFVCLNSTQSIDKLRRKKKQQFEDRIIFQRLLVQNAKVDVSEMQKKYIKATKQLIQKNKQIDIKLIQYQKQRQILIKLQKTVQKTQQQIDAIVDDLSKQKQFMRQMRNRLQNSQHKLIQLTKIRDKKKILKNINRLQLKKFLEQLEWIKRDYQNQKIQSKEQLIYDLKILLIDTDKIKDESNQDDNDDGKNKNIQNQASNHKTVIIPPNNLMKKTSRNINNKNMTQTFNENQKQNQINSNSLENKKKFKLDMKKSKFKLDMTSRNFKPCSTQRSKFRSTQRLFKRTSCKRYLPLSTQGNNTPCNLIKGQQISEIPFSHPIRYQKQQQMISRQKQDIQKKLSTQQKMMNNIKTQRGLFVSIQKKLHVQSQDLIATYNSLSFDNKNLRNFVKLYETHLDGEDKYHRINKPKSIKQFSKKMIVNFQNQMINRSSNFTNSNQTQSVSNLQLKQTPFEKYLAHKQKKMNDVNCNQNKLNSTRYMNRQVGNVIKKLIPHSQMIKSASSQKRIKTVPCTDYKI